MSNNYKRHANEVQKKQTKQKVDENETKFNDFMPKMKQKHQNKENQIKSLTECNFFRSTHQHFNK